MISEWISAILLVLGAFFMLLAAIGVLRFPDLYIRMHSATKASSFGALLMLVAVSIHFPVAYVIIEAALVIIFIFLTAPVASHMIGRIAHLLKVPKWEKTTVDELENRIDYDEEDGKTNS
ncbi:monovalent cation/H(+) antiporter subunit G [Prolixibacter sp. NT017]|jgi:multicomponent Na+:H+ antiporter subunit G|uniref:monovalent cation/H(+) antiporter subunit G n=1 Tax=Prolixibacter sp. NT017 TaxID=2652390 RepID=UPI001274910B|nr:monovalent cation/H(+) antiporter subunit G [Prolixibacter sp. NT017]GET27112.1 Na+/H+ antiporter subunit G [Prolixibacter sp. NT017]